MFLDISVIDKACDELRNSLGLRKLLGVVLNLGNRLNTAGQVQREKAIGFRLKSLLKLQVKAFDRKTTFLRYLITVVHRNNESRLLHFKNDLPSVSKAEKINWDQCLESQDIMETQVENVRALAFYQAHVLRDGVDKPNDNDSESSTFLGTWDSLTAEEVAWELRSTRVGIFALEASNRVSELRNCIEGIKRKYASLLEYFGEDNSNPPPHDLFSIICTFSRNVDETWDGLIEENKKAKVGFNTFFIGILCLATSHVSTRSMMSLLNTGADQTE